MYEVAIVGGGLMGLATSYALLKRGLRPIVVLEKERVGHDLAASTDNSKAIRLEYANEWWHTRMSWQSLQLWRALQEETAADLYVNSGVVSWARHAGGLKSVEDSYSAISDMEKELDVETGVEWVDGKELRKRYPQFAIGDASQVLINPVGGFLRATNCLRALVKRIKELNGEIRESSAVENMSIEGSQIVLRLLNGEDLRASRVVFTAGPYAVTLLPKLDLLMPELGLDVPTLGRSIPIQATKQQVVYLEGLGPEFAPDRFAQFVDLDTEFYGFPLDAAGLLKVSRHKPGDSIDPTEPGPPDLEFTEQLLQLLRKDIPTARGKVYGARVCMYTMTKDEHFILDHFPGYSNVVVGTGFSGHGFKFGPLIGEVLASLCLLEEPRFPVDLWRFKISRPKLWGTAS